MSRQASHATAFGQFQGTLRANPHETHHPVRPLSFKRHRFPADIIRHAVWLYFRFTLSFRDVEEMLAQRGIDVSYETIRCWTIKFGPQIARNLKRKRPAPSPRWHLDEVVCNIGGKRMYLWRAVDDEGEVLGCCQVKSTKLKAALPCPRSGNRRRPSGVRFGAGTPKSGSADQMTLDVEGVVDRRVGGEESLG